MSCFGVHFALTKEQERHLLSLDDDKARSDYIFDDVMEAWDEEFLAQSDKAWDAMHRTLTSYPDRNPVFDQIVVETAGPEALRLCVMGGQRLDSIVGDYVDHIIRFVDAAKVPGVAKALAGITEEWFTGNYHAYCKGVHPEYGEDDRQYTWDYFQSVRDLYARAAKAGRSVVFSADQ
jgi:hypothetical protein